MVTLESHSLTFRSVQFSPLKSVLYLFLVNTYPIPVSCVHVPAVLMSIHVHVYGFKITRSKEYSLSGYVGEPLTYVQVSSVLTPQVSSIPLSCVHVHEQHVHSTLANRYMYMYVPAVLMSMAFEIRSILSVVTLESHSLTFRSVQFSRLKLVLYLFLVYTRTCCLDEYMWLKTTRNKEYYLSGYVADVQVSSVLTFWS